MIAIQTKFLAATNSRGPRIQATANKNKIVIPYMHSSASPFAEAALSLCKKLGWTGTLLEGENDTGNVYVFSESKSYKI